LKSGIQRHPGMIKTDLPIKSDPGGTAKIFPGIWRGFNRREAGYVHPVTNRLRRNAMVAFMTIES
jgi:hypothetical protein